LVAEVLGYAKDKQALVPDLTTAMRDPSPVVRNNATRAFLVFARFSPKPPAQKINIPPEPFVAMLNSCIWTDRNKSSGSLGQLTEQRDPSLLAILREQALPSLVEMARWKSMGHAWSSLVILGRIDGLSEEEIQKDLGQGNREKIITAARNTAKRWDRRTPKQLGLPLGTGSLRRRISMPVAFSHRRVGSSILVSLSEAGGHEPQKPQASPFSLACNSSGPVG